MGLPRASKLFKGILSRSKLGLISPSLLSDKTPFLYFIILIFNYLPWCWCYISQFSNWFYIFSVLN